MLSVFETYGCHRRHVVTETDLASERLVLETEHFVVSAPFACRERWRLYLAPKRHSPVAGRQVGTGAKRSGDQLQGINSNGLKCF